MELGDDDPVKLLLVDDREEDLGVLQLILDDPGYTLVPVRSGPEALKRLLVDDFAVILLDVMLPGVDGFEVARLVQQRERSRNTPILFMTAMGSDMNYIFRAYSAGAVDYLSKPVEPDVVRAKVAVFANLFRQDRRIRRQVEALREAEQREKEREVAELRRGAEERYRNLADAVPAIVWTAGPDGALSYANRAWHHYTGLGRASSAGLGWLQALHPDDRDAVERTWCRCVERCDDFTMEARLASRDGGYRAHTLHAIPERDGDGKVLGWLGTMTDVEELRQAISARDQFLATASHELRTPLATLSLVNEALRELADDPGVPEAVRNRLEDKLQVAARQNDRLDRLVGALLDVTRIAGGRPLLERERCDACQVVREAVERLREQASRSGTSIALTAEGQATGWFDPLRLDQVVTNLVSNAIRHADGKPVEVEVEADDGRARIVVRDHGSGIPREQLGRLFGRFQRGDSRRHQGGLGLGLYISRHIARAHGGDINVTSSLGQGATFVVELPRQPDRPSGGVAATRGDDHR
jgi:PAS domain S-box-containing protein